MLPILFLCYLRPIYLDSLMMGDANGINSFSGYRRAVEKYAGI